MKTINYDFLNCAKMMPPLNHAVPNCEFDINDSDVADWLSSQPEIKQKLFEFAKNKRLIVFDAESHTWRGIDYAN
jgi:hypothetical protein